MNTYCVTLQPCVTLKFDELANLLGVEVDWGDSLQNAPEETWDDATMDYLKDPVLQARIYLAAGERVRLPETVPMDLVNASALWDPPVGMYRCDVTSKYSNAFGLPVDPTAQGT